MLSIKNRQKPGQVRHTEQSLYPVLYVTDHLREYKEDLIQKEVESLSELGQIRKSFSGVMQKADHFQTQLEEFGGTFTHINDAAEQFSDVKSSVTQSVSDAEGQVENLKNISMEIENTFREMEDTFIHLQNAVKSIRHCINNIVSIADETNILAINASIEASRAGEDGKGFAVVAAKVKELAEEIKTLATDADAGIHNVETGTTELNESITASAQTLGQGTGIVGKTYELSADYISGRRRLLRAGRNCQRDRRPQKELQTICQFFDDIKLQYQEVVKHINRASNLGTTKSAMFEDIDNMLSQIPPIIKDTNPVK